ncbi:hypothetical protein SGLAM104S_00867 [Streptomyces glaucescens]
MVLEISEDWSIPALLLAWLIAVAIRLATGSATVATVSAAGLVAPLAADMSTTHAALLVLAIGAGSLFFSHVNDAGFWLVKEYFGLNVGQTIKTWSVMETIISVVAGALVLLLSLIISRTAACRDQGRAHLRRGWALRRQPSATTRPPPPCPAGTPRCRGRCVRGSRGPGSAAPGRGRLRRGPPRR